MFERLTISLDRDLVRQVEDLRFERRYPNKSATLADLVRIGLANVPQAVRPAPPEKVA